jgi:glycosyltransferase involved in cell wall biosynthesis
MNFNFSPIGEVPKRITIPANCDIVFVSDMFLEDYAGGAELTSEALIESSPLSVHKLKSKDVNLKMLESGVEKYWIFGNFSQMDLQLIPTIVANMNYSILEYDYKFCKYRSVEKHRVAENKECDCHADVHGKIMSAFFYGSKSLWWMSEGQEKIYHKKFPFLKERNNTVLSSVFSDSFFSSVQMLKEKYKNHKRSGWIVLGSDSWIKGADDAVKWCETNKKEYELVWNLPYSQILEKLSQAQGFVYLPKGNDTCPRMVIEAKMLGCELHLNNFVQHKDEEWFSSSDSFDTAAYLYAARERFWNGIKYDMTYCPTISGYTTVHNCISQKYPFVSSISSMLAFCDEVIVVDGGSSDGTWEKLQQLSESHENLVLHQEKRDWKHPRHAVLDGAQKALARSICASDFCWQQDSDEIVHEDDYKKIKLLVKNFPKQPDLIALPVIEYWGGPDKVRMDINPWKWRLSRNKPNITHGIPKDLRKFDKDGNLYSLPGTDGCDYIMSANFERVPFANFYTKDVEELRSVGLTDPGARESYQTWFKKSIDAFPSVHHYSWYDISRKIKTYKNYWSQHWQSLYNIPQSDTPDNNMFFNKAWSEVTESEIEDLAIKLSDKMGGWIFHQKIDFNSPTPHLELDQSHPDIIKEWIQK